MFASETYIDVCGYVHMLLLMVSSQQVGGAGLCGRKIRATTYFLIRRYWVRISVAMGFCSIQTSAHEPVLFGRPQFVEWKLNLEKLGSEFFLGKRGRYQNKSSLLHREKTSYLLSYMKAKLELNGPSISTN